MWGTESPASIECGHQSGVWNNRLPWIQACAFKCENTPWDFSAMNLLIYWRSPSVISLTSALTTNWIYSVMGGSEMFLNQWSESQRINLCRYLYSSCHYNIYLQFSFMILCIFPSLVFLHKCNCLFQHKSINVHSLCTSWQSFIQR
jgi:hypothetical protein